MTIWKYVLRVIDSQLVAMPEGAQILSAHVQNGELCIWALVNPGAVKKPRTIEINGTGHRLSSKVNRRFIGTVLVHQFVWHVFEVL